MWEVENERREHVPGRASAKTVVRSDCAFEAAVIVDGSGLRGAMECLVGGDVKEWCTARKRVKDTDSFGEIDFILQMALNYTRIAAMVLYGPLMISSNFFLL